MFFKERMKQTTNTLILHRNVLMMYQCMKQLLNEAEYDMRNYAGEENEENVTYLITVSKICILLHIIRNPNSIIVLLFIQNISKSV